MSEFTCSIEREVASSLLLLSSGPLFFASSSDTSRSEGSLSLSFVSTGTRSCDSAISSNDFMNFKIAKKRRTSVVLSPVDSKPTRSKNHHDFDHLSKCSDEDSKEESCLSTGSSEISTTESVSHEKPYRGSKKRESHRSSSIRRKAVMILEFLSRSCSSEFKIRQVLGDSADTSKALRMLLKMSYVKRSGAGGKHHPFIYTIA